MGNCASCGGPLWGTSVMAPELNGIVCQRCSANRRADPAARYTSPGLEPLNRVLDSVCRNPNCVKCNRAKETRRRRHAEERYNLRPRKPSQGHL